MQTTHGQLYFSKLCYLHKQSHLGLSWMHLGGRKSTLLLPFLVALRMMCSMKHTVIIVARESTILFFDGGSSAPPDFKDSIVA